MLNLRASVFCLLFFACYLRHLEAYYLRALFSQKGFSLFSIVFNASWGFLKKFEDFLWKILKKWIDSKGICSFLSKNWSEKGINFAETYSWGRSGILRKRFWRILEDKGPGPRGRIKICRRPLRPPYKWRKSDPYCVCLKQIIVQSVVWINEKKYKIFKVWKNLFVFISLSVPNFDFT